MVFFCLIDSIRIPWGEVWKNGPCHFLDVCSVVDTMLVVVLIYILILSVVLRDEGCIVSLIL